MIIKMIRFQNQNNKFQMEIWLIKKIYFLKINILKKANFLKIAK